MLQILQTHFIVTTLCVVVLTILGRFVAKGYAVRRRLRSLPCPPGHSWLWGHLLVIADILKDCPDRIHPNAIAIRLQKKYDLPNFFYVDIWPIEDPMLYVLDPDVARQIAQANAPKHRAMRDFMIELAGPGDLVSSNGNHWKKWRNIMNPGFAATHLMTLSTKIVDHGLMFVEKLREHADKHEVFRLEEDATRLTVDVIGDVVLDLRLGMQGGEHEMVTAMREQNHLMPTGNPADYFKMWYPLGMYRRGRNSRIMNTYLGKVLDDRFAKQDSENNGVPRQKKERKRAVIDLALEAYRAQQTDSLRTDAGLDDAFKQSAIVQIRTFILAGHDTTSSVICYALYMLSQHPDCLAEIRREHSEVLGTIDDTPDVIKKDPYIVNRLEYTMCVIRETLRLWPPANSTRRGDPGFLIRDPKSGEAFPTNGFLLSIEIYGIHRNPQVWGESVGVFDPSRFLDADRQPEEAFRPFEKGPRNCIGQELAMLELRIILALMVRSFDFKLAYDELDKLKDDGSFYAKDESFRRGRQDLDGEEAWNMLLTTAKPREGMPMRVSTVS